MRMLMRLCACTVALDYSVYLMNFDCRWTRSKTLGSHLQDRNSSQKTCTHKSDPEEQAACCSRGYLERKLQSPLQDLRMSWPFTLAVMVIVENVNPTAADNLVHCCILLAWRIQIRKCALQDPAIMLTDNGWPVQMPQAYMLCMAGPTLIQEHSLEGPVILASSR